MIDKFELISKMPLFKNCSDSTIRMVSEDTYARKFKQNDTVMTPATSTRKVALIANEGRMKVFVNNRGGDKFIVYLLTFGDLFNVITLLDMKQDYLFASAIDDLDILFCDINVARGWITKSSDFSNNMLRYLSKRLRMVQEDNVERTFYSIEIRLARLIFKNIFNENGDRNLTNDLSHEEIAKYLGTSRAVVNRNLQKLKQSNLIDIKRKKILVEDYEKMKTYIKAHTSFGSAT